MTGGNPATDWVITRHPLSPPAQRPWRTGIGLTSLGPEEMETTVGELATCDRTPRYGGAVRGAGHTKAGAMAGWCPYEFAPLPSCHHVPGMDLIGAARACSSHRSIAGTRARARSRSPCSLESAAWARMLRAIHDSCIWDQLRYARVRSACTSSEGSARTANSMR